MKIAVIQIHSGSNKIKNVEKSVDIVKNSIDRGAKFILLPEVFNFRGEIRNKNHLLEIAENIPSGSLMPLIKLAKEEKVCILAGSIYEKDTKGRVFNTSVLINDKGNIQAKYRKIHLFNAQLPNKNIREDKVFCPGIGGVVSKVDDFHMGLSICFDIRFPNLYQKYARQNADVLCVPSAFTKITGQDHWHALIRSRAIENLCYVLAPNQVGEDETGLDTFGHSLIVSPWGEILAEASSGKEEIIYAEISKNYIKEKRTILPIYKKK